MLIGTIIILVVTAAFFVVGKMRSDLVALCSLLALLICQILTPEEALSGFSNSVVIMMVGLFVVGGAIVQTGLAKMISRKVMRLAGTSELRLFLLVMLVTAVIGAFVSNTGTVALMLPVVVSMGGSGPILLLAGIYFTTSLMTMFISNTVTAVLMAPIALNSALQIGVNPVPYLFAVTVAASMCFASPFSTPPNALVMPAGGYSFMDYIKVGLPLQIIMGLVMIAVLPLIFPF